MRPFAAILLITAIVLTMAVAPASAGYKDQWAKFRTTRTTPTLMKDKTDSKVICYVFKPWPWKCACDVDSDHDGVFDSKDKCPNTPKGCKVDAKGCPIDSDGDGVCDGIDKCPNTPAGTKVDETGCPVEVKKFIDTGLISSTEVLFDLGKATLKPESKAVLDKIGKILVQVPDTKVEIGGHTDATGSDKTNMKLSDDRANAVRDYLLKSFSALKADNLSAKGYGKTVPVASNDTKEGRAKNRRVEFKIMK